MKTRKIRLWGLLSVSVVSLFCAAERRAIVFIKPVVNLISQDPFKISRLEYFLNTYSPEEGSGCPRTFQALFGEVGFIDDAAQLHGGYANVELCNCFFSAKTGEIKPLYYWAKREDFVFLHGDLSPEAQNCFPEPIFYQRPESVFAPGVVTLAEPWTSEQNRLTYSAGTRFRTTGDNTGNKSKTVKLFDISRGIQLIESIPTKLLVNGGAIIPAAERRKHFVKLLKKWCKKQLGLIPYIWGGASYLARTKNEKFRLVEEVIDGKKISYWMREESKLSPDGFDCSGLVLRATQAANIPYFCRTAGTAGSVLMPLPAQAQSIEPGDLFVTTGHNHVFVAAGHLAGYDMIIEAAGYSAGFARVHLIPVSKRFFNANSYADLIALFRAGQVPVYRSREGHAVTPSGFMIVKLPV